MDHQEEIIREQICDVCHKMWQLGWVAANDGNVSVRLDQDTIIATPTGISKSVITPEKLVKLNLKGEIIEAQDGYRPSSEIKMHIRCYEEREDVNAVVHAHPPIATGFALAHIPLDTYSLIESAIVVGAIPITPFGVPSTMEVPDAITPYLPEHDVMLLENHGALTVGSDVITAYYRMETLLRPPSTDACCFLLRELRRKKFLVQPWNACLQCGPIIKSQAVTLVIVNIMVTEASKNKKHWRK